MANKAPRKGELWKVDYTYKYKAEELTKSPYEIESNIKKLRPSLVISNDQKNLQDNQILVIPLTSIELDKIEPFEMLIKANSENGLDQDSKVLVDIIRTIDKNHRLHNKVGQINSQQLFPF